MVVGAVNLSNVESGNKVDQERKICVVQRLAKEILLDVVICALFVGMALPFMTHADMMNTLVFSTSLLAFSILLKGAYAFHVYRKVDGDYVKERGGLFKTASETSGFAPALYCSIPRNTLIHEGGHAVAAELMYKGAKPTITVDGATGGGMTSYYNSRLTHFGRMVGEKASRAIVAGAGPLFGVITACVDISIAHKIRKTEPEWSRRFNLMAIYNIFHHAMYAISALYMSGASHDFVNLWRFAGLHPIAAAVTIIAIPILLKVALNHLQG